MISRRVRASWQVLEETYGKDAKVTNSFDEFCEEFITVSDSERQLMPRGKIASVYSRWCEKNGKLEVAPSTISKVGTKRGWQRKMKGKHVYYVGVSLNINQKNKRRKVS